MADPLDINQDSALEGFLRWLGRPGYAVRDVLTGNLGGAVRQGVDFFTDPIDAVLPGDVLPEMSRKGEDYTEASDLFGGMEPGWGKTAVDVVGGIATDPMTYLGVGPFVKAATLPLQVGAKTAAGLASKTAAGAEAVNALKGAGEKVAFTLRSATGNLKPSAPIASAVAAGEGSGAATTKAAKGFVVPEFSAFDPDTQRRAIEITRGVSSELTPGAYADLDALAGIPKSAQSFVTRAEQEARIDARLAQMPWTPDEKAMVKNAAMKANDFTRGQWEQGVKDSVFSQDPATAGMAPADYLPGVYEMDDAAKAGAASGAPSIIGAKELRDSAALSDWLNTSKAKLDADLPSLLGDYGSRMGSAVKQAEIGKRISPGFRTLAEDRGQFKTIIDNLKTQGMHDDAAVLETAIQGLPPREGIMKVLADFNAKIFKPFATGGAFLPRPSFAARNVVSGAAMAASNPEARGAALGQLASAPKDLIGAWADGLRDLGLPMPKPEHVAQVEDAIKASGGKREAMLAAIPDPTLRDAVRLGVIDNGFVTSEQMAADIAQKAKGIKDWRNWRDWPQGLSRGSEERMRLGLFTRLTEGGMPAEQAAKVTKDSLYDYAYSSTLNRTMRDIIPFAQFTNKAVPQQAKFLMESGVVPSVGRNLIENLYNQGEGAVLPPQLQDQPVIPLGQDEAGNPSYLTSFGMPWEALGQVPNLTGDLADIGPEIRRNLVSASNPVLKTAYSVVSGEDPYFGTPFGSYDRAPYAAQALGADKESQAARVYNILAGSGAIHPISSPVSVLSGLADPRRSVGETALNTLTGVRVKSVDEQQALRQLLEDALKKNPNVQRYESLYQQSPDHETQAMLDELKKIKGDIRERRQSEPAQPAPQIDPKALADSLSDMVRHEIAIANGSHRVEIMAALEAAVARMRLSDKPQSVKVAVPDVPEPGEKPKRGKVRFIVHRDGDGVITGIEAEE